MDSTARHSWYLVKYLADPRRREPRNVGICLRSGDNWTARFVGEREDGSIDGRHLRPYGLDGEVYRTWVDYFRRKIEAAAWEDVERLQRRRSSNFYAEVGGYDFRSSDPNTLLEELFTELVGVARTRTDDRSALQFAAEDVLKRANLSYEKHVQVPARFGQHGRLTTVSFPLSHTNGQVHLMDTVRMSNKAPGAVRELWARMAAARQADSATSFVVFYSHGQVETAGKIEDLLLPLEEEAATVDLDDRVAAVEVVLNAITTKH